MHPEDDRVLHNAHWRTINDETSPLRRAEVSESMRESSSYHQMYTTLDNCILSRADTVFLSDDLRELVKTVEVTMPDEVIFDTDVYTPCGFVVMESPLENKLRARCAVDDLDEIMEKVKSYGGAVTGTRLYGESDSGTYIGTENWSVQAFAWADNRAISQYAFEEIERIFGVDSDQYEMLSILNNKESSNSAIHFRVYGQLNSTTIDGVTMEVPIKVNRPLQLTDHFVYFYGEEGKDKEGVPPLPEEGSASDRHRNNRRFLVALFRLMEEYIEVDKSVVPRQQSRRATRGGRIGDVKNITTLSLRREIRDSEHHGDGTKITLAHLVRGHWRNQWYPSQKTHRAKWIRAHRRGGAPGDTPVEKPRIIRVDR